MGSARVANPFNRCQKITAAEKWMQTANVNIYVATDIYTKLGHKIDTPLSKPNPQMLDMYFR